MSYAPSRRVVLGLPAAFSLSAPATAQERQRVTAYATRSGYPAADGRNGSGNPFATAFIEGLAANGASLRDLLRGAQDRTIQLTGGRQAPMFRSPVPDVSLLGNRLSRSALVLTWSDYEALEALPGAAVDGPRVSSALSATGFDTTLATNLGADALRDTLESFGERSARSDLSLLYCTGHGVEVGGRQYVLPLDFDPSRGEEELTRGFLWEQVASASSGGQVGVSIWAGCRDNPYGWAPPARAG